VGRIVGLLQFGGRLSRLQFWRDYLFLAIISAVDVIIGMLAIMALGPWGGIFVAPFILVMVASIAIVVRRLHDRNKSALWLLPFAAVPLGVQLWVVGEARDEPAGLVLVVALASLTLNIWGLVEIGFRRGTAGGNRFGEQPPT
jgi:uncharacterized membrane protein YhaH (DUF805 family)